MSDKTVVLFTGSRHLDDDRTKQMVYDILWEYDPDKVIIRHGNARGLDRIVDEQARLLSFEVQAFEAEWDEYGRAAGHIRNKQMLETEPIPVLVHAFPHPHLPSKGTWDCVSQAGAHGIFVAVYKVGE